MLAFGEPPRNSHHQCPCEIGGRFVEHARRVRGHYAAFRACIHVDVVVADGNVCGNAQFRRNAKKFVVHFFGEQADEAFLVFHAAQHFFARRTFILAPIFHVAGGVQDLAGFVKQLVGRVHFRSCHARPLKIWSSYTSTARAAGERHCQRAARVTIVGTPRHFGAGPSWTLLSFVN